MLQKPTYIIHVMGDPGWPPKVRDALFSTHASEAKECTISQRPVRYTRCSKSLPILSTSWETLGGHRKCATHFFLHTRRRPRNVRLASGQSGIRDAPKAYLYYPRHGRPWVATESARRTFFYTRVGGQGMY